MDVFDFCWVWCVASTHSSHRGQRAVWTLWVPVTALLCRKLCRVTPAADIFGYSHLSPCPLPIGTCLACPERGLQPASSWGSEQALAIPIAADPADIEAA